MSSSSSRSRLESLWEDHERHWRRIEELERRMDESVTRKRRRIANLLDEVSTHRRSHLRLFVTHKRDFSLLIEGKLLVGHLDHASADAVEQEAAEEARLTLEEGEDDDDLLIRSTDRTLYRGKSENEGDVPVDKIVFTHFFDKLQVSTRTVYVTPEAPKTTSTPKKSRSKPKRGGASGDETKNLSTSSPKEYTWERSMTTDAHAWVVRYTPEPPTSPEKKVHSVVSTIKLWPQPGPETLYKPSAALATALFPEHVPVEALQKKSKKAKQQQEEPEIPLDNDIIVPPTLTMKEIVSTLFFYIQEKKLHDDLEPSVVVNDKLLSNLFSCDRMNFADVQSLLFSKELVTDATHEPIVLTYYMTPETASPSLGEAQAQAQAPPTDDDTIHIPQVLSFDTDVYVEGVLHFRARELLRRIKRREFEYTSSRTKARNLLLAGRAKEFPVKSKIEDAVNGRGYTADHIPVWLALAKSAPPKSEARAAAQMDAKICLLLEKLNQHVRAAQAAWDVVDACSAGGGREEEDESKK